MNFPEAFAAGVLKYAYSAEWMGRRGGLVRQFQQGQITRDQLIQEASKAHDRPPFEEPENFQQAYYNVHYWSNRAKVLGDKKLYRKKDEAIIRGLRHLNFKGIVPIRPRGHPGLLEIQVPTHGVLLHTYSPVVKKLIQEEGFKVPIRRSPAEAYLREGREAGMRKRLAARQNGLTRRNGSVRIPVLSKGGV